MIVFPRNKAIVYRNPVHNGIVLYLFIVDSGEEVDKGTVLYFVVRYKWLYYSSNNL